MYYFTDNALAIAPTALWNDETKYIEVPFTSTTIEDPVTLSAGGELFFFSDGSGPGPGLFRFTLTHKSAGQGIVEVNGVTGNIKQKRGGP